MCGGDTPTAATVDPAAERQKAADEAAKKANQQLLMDARRKRGQQGLLSSDDTEASFLARAVSAGGVKAPRRRSVLETATASDGRRRRVSPDGLPYST